MFRYIELKFLRKFSSNCSFFFVVYAVAVLISRPFTGKLFDNKGPNSIMYPTIISFAIGMIILSQAKQTLL